MGDHRPEEEGEPTSNVFSELAPDKPSIQTMMLADRAEVHDGKLYIMGGVISQFWVPSFPGQLSFSVALVIDVPWHATNQPLKLHLGFENEDGKELGAIDLGMTTGRHPILLQGDASYIAKATPILNFVAPEAGRYVVSCTLDDGRPSRLPFRVRQQGQ